MNVLPDVLRKGLRVVFCGTAAGTASARAGAYYAGPGNAFWPTLHAIGLIPHHIAPADFATVTRYGIGLTDIVKTASGADSDLRHTDFDAEGLAQRVGHYAPRVLAFNGKRSAQAAFGTQRLSYGPQPNPFAGVRAWVLPSTSGAARRYWDSRYWHELAKELSDG